MMNAMSIVARHLLISGRVQGVYYRGWTVETARSLGLAGWVRNLRSGDVEALVEGPEDAVARFIALAHDGPAAARVQGVAIREEAAAGLSSFDKRATA